MLQLPPYWKVKKGNHPVVRELTFRGMKISVETDKGSYRYWYDPDGKERGKTLMHYPYGYFQGTKASGMSGDNMALDVYVGPVEDAENVYVVRQMKKPDFKEFDELKVMVGFETAKRARLAYLMHYNDDRFLGEIETYTVDEFKAKYITPHVEKALSGKDVGVMLTSAPMNPSQNENPAGVQPQGTPNQPPPARMPGMPMMGPGQLIPPMVMGPPPIDVETIDGVKSLLGRVGNMKDPELLNVVKEIWGPGYQYINATPEHVRCEVMGFLLDQRDLLELTEQAQMLGDSPDQTSSPSLPPSSSGQPPAASPSGAANFSGAASVPPPSTDLSQQEPSQKFAMDLSDHIKSPQASLNS